MPLEMLHKVISKIYEEKIQADAVADKESRVRQSLPTFLVAYFHDKYGLKSLADTHIGQLVAAVRIHAKPVTAFVPAKSSKEDESEGEEQEAADPRVSVFGHISGISLEATRRFVAAEQDVCAFQAESFYQFCTRFWMTFAHSLACLRSNVAQVEHTPGQHTGMAYGYTACNVNFIMDLLSRMITDHEDIDETLNDPDVEDRSLTIPKIEVAITQTYRMRRQPVPEYLLHVLKDLSFLDKPCEHRQSAAALFSSKNVSDRLACTYRGRLLPELIAAQGEAALFSSKNVATQVRMIDIDHVLDISLQLWLETMEEGDQLLRKTFTKFDKNEDGKLSLDEFAAAVKTVEGERRVSKTGRGDKEVSQMYQQALQESAGKNDVITMEGFLTVAGHYNLGVPYVDPTARHDAELEEEVGGVDGLVAEDQGREDDGSTSMLDDMDRLMKSGRNLMEGGGGGEDGGDSDDGEQTRNRRDFLANAKKLRDTKEGRERVQRRLGLSGSSLGKGGSRYGVTCVEGSTKSFVQGSTKDLTTSVVADENDSIKKDGRVSVSTGTRERSQGRLVFNGERYERQSEHSDIVERRPCWWTPAAMSPHVAKDEAERVGFINHRTERLLRRCASLFLLSSLFGHILVSFVLNDRWLWHSATIEYFFTVAQVERILAEVPPSGKEAVLLVLFNTIVDP